MIKCTVGLLLFACPVWSQVAEVTSGEHETFTRIVIAAEGIEDWRFGRTPGGYEFDPGRSGLHYDVSDVFRLIPKDRLSAVWTDPVSGRLQFGLACSCHALPFEYRQGTVVIDIKDGLPTQSSVFEDAIDGGVVAVLGQTKTPRPRSRSDLRTVAYDWLAQKPQDVAVHPTIDTPFKVSPSDLGPLRDALIQEISLGMAEGVLQIAQPGARPKSTQVQQETGPWVRVSLGDVPGFVTNGRPGARPEDFEDDQFCPQKSVVSLQDWRPEGSPTEAIAQSRDALVTEFDKPDMAAVTGAVQTLIYLGFGAEASQLINEFATPMVIGDFSILEGIARVIDGHVDVDGPFSGMATCDSAAALWAFLAEPAMDLPRSSNRNAILQSFSALPQHLRTSLGPEVMLRFQNLNDAAAVASVKDSIDRIPGNQDGMIAIANARLDLETGDLSKAEQVAESVVPENTAIVDERRILLIEAKLAQKKPISRDEAAELEVLIPQFAGQPREPDLSNLLTLAMLASGQTDQARHMLDENPEVEGNFWDIAATLSSDDSLLSLAVLNEDSVPENIAESTRLAIADRLMSKGFSDAALAWLKVPASATSAQIQMRLAKAYLVKKNPDAALAVLGAVVEPVDQDLTALAFESRQDWNSAENAWKDAGNAAAAQRVQVMAQNWKKVAAGGPEPWRDVAKSLNATGIANPSLGPLAQSAQLTSSSAADRLRMQELLSGLAIP